MYSAYARLKNASGLHARPAACFVQLAKSFQSKITVRRANTKSEVNAKSIIMILSLGLTKGTEIEIIAEGEDEVLAVNELVKLIESGFDE